MPASRSANVRRTGEEAVSAPPVRLGQLLPRGLAPAILAIVERGARRRPEMARSLDIEVELVVLGDYPPLRLVFSPEEVLVEDAPARAPALRVRGELADLIGLMVAPIVGGVPMPFTARGRNAVAMVASRRIRVQGRLGLLRRLLAVIQI